MRDIYINARPRDPVASVVSDDTVSFEIHQATVQEGEAAILRRMKDLRAHDELATDITDEELQEGAWRLAADVAARDRMDAQGAIDVVRAQHPKLLAGTFAASWTPAGRGIPGFWWVTYRTRKSSRYEWTVEPAEGYKPVYLLEQCRARSR